MKNAIAVALSITVLFKPDFSAAAMTKVEQDSTKAVLALYSSTGTYSNLFKLVGRTDPEFSKKGSAEKLPKVELKGDAVLIEGVQFPLKIVDLKSGIFSLDGHKLVFEFKGNPNKLLNQISEILTPKSYSKIGILLPEAKAVAFLPAVGAVYALGAGIAFGGCMTSVMMLLNHQTSTGEKLGMCGAISVAWPVLAASAVVMAAVSVAKADEPILPTKLVCEGNKKLSLFDAKNNKVSITEESGKSVISPNPSGSVSMKTSAAIATLQATCKSPAMVAKINQIYSQGKTTSSQTNEPTVAPSGVQ